VVLPFANIGGDPEQDYFVDGVTESLTTDLSRISGSFVIGRHRIRLHKGKCSSASGAYSKAFAKTLVSRTPQCNLQEVLRRLQQSGCESENGYIVRHKRWES
jgi:hypothetical protein